MNLLLPLIAHRVNGTSPLARRLALGAAVAAALALTGCVVAPPRSVHSGVAVGTVVTTPGVVTGTAVYGNGGYPAVVYPDGSYGTGYPGYPVAGYPGYGAPGVYGGVVVAQPRVVVSPPPVVIGGRYSGAYGGGYRGEHGRPGYQLPQPQQPRVQAPPLPQPPPVVNPRSPGNLYGMQNGPAQPAQNGGGRGGGFRHQDVWR